MCENSKFKFRDNFGIKKRALGLKCRIGGSMYRLVLQCVLEVPAGTSNPNQSAKYELEMPAGTSSFKKTFSASFFIFIRLFNVVPLFMINTRYNSDFLNLLKIFELIYFN
jgi:hypothetical protein